MKIKLNELAAKLQDAWHYANLVTGLGWSTFEGDTEFLGIAGKCNAYQNLARVCDDLGIEAKSLQHIQTGEELKAEACALQSKIADIAEKHGIISSAGEVKNLSRAFETVEI